MKSKNFPKIYIILDGQRHHIQTLEYFTLMRKYELLEKLKNAKSSEIIDIAVEVAKLNNILRKIDELKKVEANEEVVVELNV